MRMSTSGMGTDYVLLIALLLRLSQLRLPTYF